MKKLTTAALLSLFMVFSYTRAQKAKSTVKAIAAEKTSTTVAKTFLGSSGLQGGPITKADFDRYLRQGLTARDSAGTAFEVKEFMFSYAERNLYEDSIGKLMILTDFLSEFCPGDTVTTAVTNNIYYKTKPGDTAYFDHIKVRVPSSGQIIQSSPMKFVIVK